MVGREEEHARIRSFLGIFVLRCKLYLSFHSPQSQTSPPRQETASTFAVVLAPGSQFLLLLSFEMH